MINVLFLANNNLSPTSGGIERTTFNLLKVLSNDSGFNLFAVFIKIPEIIKGVVCVEDTITSGKQIDDYINRFQIDIAVFPGGAWYTNLLKNYNSKTQCKIVTCLHSPPKVGEDHFIQNLNLEFRKKNFSSKIKSLPHFIFNYLRQPLKVYQARKQYFNGYKNSDVYVLLSTFYFNDFKEYAKIADVKKLYAIGNALSFEKSFDVGDLSLKKNEVLLVGRFDEVSKRISYSIKSWGLIDHKNWKFKIVGFGKDEMLYQNLVKDLQIKNISFEGKQNPIKYYADAKIFLMTSLFEGWPMTLLEALQMGCVPVVMDSFGSLQEIIVHNYNGLIIKNDDIQEMANAVQSLITNKEKLLQLSVNAISSSENFTLEKTAQKWKDLFNQIT